MYFGSSSHFAKSNNSGSIVYDQRNSLTFIVFGFILLYFCIVSFPPMDVSTSDNLTIRQWE